MKGGQLLLALVTILAVLGLLAGGCASLPAQEERTVSTALTATGDTRIGRGVQASAAGHPGKTGIYPLDDPRSAFAARALLARAADRSLDVQYYIWHGDTTGYLLLEELWNAAERGGARAPAPGRQRHGGPRRGPRGAGAPTAAKPWPG